MINVIAETAFSHMGQVEYLISAIDKISSAKVKFIKFQILLNLNVYDSETDMYKALKNCMISAKDWKYVIDYATRKGLNVLVLPIDYDALIFAINEKVDAIEIHSICLNDVKFLEILNLSNYQGIVFLGAGGRNNNDIDFCLSKLNNIKKFVLLFGFQSFPTKKNNINLAKLDDLRNNFQIKLGYADHTSFDDDDSDIMYIALSKGVKYIEKHFILQIGDEERHDYHSAKDMSWFNDINKLIQNFIILNGIESNNIMNEKEINYKNRERKIIISKNILKGEVLAVDNIAYKVIEGDTDLEQKDYYDLIGKVATCDISINTVLTASHYN